MILVNVPKIYGKSVINIWEMLLQYMGKVSKIYGKCVRKYMVKVPLVSEVYCLCLSLGKLFPYDLYLNS